MNDKIKELLAVLDLPEIKLDENRAIHQPQYEWLYEHRHDFEAYLDVPHPDCTFGGDKTKMFLADLAFRLRDEVIEQDLNWDDALVLVWEQLGRSMKYQTFCKYYTKPIHWIITALIAKELSKRDKENE